MLTSVQGTQSLILCCFPCVLFKLRHRWTEPCSFLVSNLYYFLFRCTEDLAKKEESVRVGRMLLRNAQAGRREARRALFDSRVMVRCVFSIVYLCVYRLCVALFVFVASRSL